MRLIKLPFKILAVIAVLALTIFILIAKLINRLSSFVMGLLLLVLIVCAEVFAEKCRGSLGAFIRS